MLKLGKISDDLLKEYFKKVEEHLKAKFTTGKSSLTHINKEIENIENKNTKDTEDTKKLEELKNKKADIENYKIQIENDDKLEKIGELIKCQNIYEIINNNQNYFKELEDIYENFDWDTFRANKERKKVFKEIINKLELKVCPYCGRNHIDAIEVKGENEEKIVVPCLDHFWAKGAKTKEQKDNEEKNGNCSDSNELDKNKYAQYQLSIYNLIPSCYLCNSQFKHDRDVEDQEYKILYPYKEGFEDNIIFNFDFKSKKKQMQYINQLTGFRDSVVDIHIKLFKRKKIKINSIYLNGAEKDEYLNRCRNSNKMFHLEELYDFYHRQNAVDLINKIVWFRNNYFKSVANILKLKKPLGKAFEFLFGRWLDKDNDLKEPLSKFYRDIYEQITNPQLYEPLMESETCSEEVNE